MYFYLILDENDEEIKKCTKKCIEKVREPGGEKPKDANHLGKLQRKEKNKLKSFEEEENPPQGEIKPQAKTKKFSQNSDKCYFTDQNSTNFCNKIIDVEGKDHRKKSLHNCLNYFCPLCCESDFQGIFLKNEFFINYRE